MGLSANRFLSLVATVVALVAVPMNAARPAAEVSLLPISIRGTVGDRHHVVDRGDHLWKISRQFLESTLGRAVTVEEVDRYWRLVIAANRGRIRSGDPDLIYPGEEIVLPDPG